MAVNGEQRGKGSLQDKIALVTGSSSGIGRAICLAYAAEGAYMVCADLNPLPRKESSSIKDSSRTTHELMTSSFPSNITGKDRAIFVTCDTGDAKNVEAAVKAAANTYGRLDIMVNCAGVSAIAKLPAPALIHETPEETFDLDMRVNAKGVWLGCKYACAQMLEQEPHSSGDRGWVINLSSIYGVVGSGYTSSYCASKGAVTNLTRSVAVGYGPHRIHVNSINPGFIDTPMVEDTAGSDPEKFYEMVKARHPWDRLGRAEEIAKAAVFLAGDGASFITGHNLLVDGGYTAQ